MKYRVAESASIICFCLCFAVSCQRDPQPTPSTPPPPALAKGLQLLPIDEASKDSSFLKFREELLQAVERRDATYVLGILDPHIKNNFGGDGGIDEFRETWKPEQADSELWKELRFVLTHGGAFMGEGFWAPYVFSSFPELSQVPGYDDEPFRFGAMIESNVLLRSKPEESAEAVATLTYHIVKSIDEDKLPQNWAKVSTTEGVEGYIPASALRYPIDYRAGFAKQNGVWRMNLFLAGD